MTGAVCRKMEQMIGAVSRGSRRWSSERETAQPMMGAVGGGRQMMGSSGRWEQMMLISVRG
jgi:hypothetical protein